MALFKSRKGGDEPPAAAAQPESAEAMRRRAKHRLIGAFVLVLLGVVGFPLLFDTQPRPIPVDIPIDIPDRNKAKPLAVPAPSPVSTAQPTVPQSPAVASGTVTAAPAASAPAVTEAKAESKAETKPPVAVAKAEPKAPEPKPAQPQAEAKPEAKPAAKADDGARAQALLEGKPVDVTEGRFVVQVGAFADAGKARETRLKVERAGMKTYTHVADTKEGKITRVRVGPFGSRAEADKAAEKLKGLDLQPRVLTL